MRVEELILDGESGEVSLNDDNRRLMACRLQVVSRQNNHIW